MDKRDDCKVHKHYGTQTKGIKISEITGRKMFSSTRYIKSQKGPLINEISLPQPQRQNYKTP